MTAVDLGTIVAERRLTLAPDGVVTVRIGLPFTPAAHPGESWCPYQISGLGSGKVRRVVGIDSIQALWLTLQTIGAELYASPEYEAGRLHSFDQEPDLGFPLPESLRDLLPPGVPPQ